MAGCIVDVREHNIEQPIIDAIIGFWIFIISSAAFVLSIVFHDYFRSEHDRRRYLLCRVVVWTGLFLSVFTCTIFLLDVTNAKFSSLNTTVSCYNPAAHGKQRPKLGQLWVVLMFMDIAYIVFAIPFAVSYYITDFPSVPPSWPEKKFSNHYQKFEKKKEEEKLKKLQDKLEQQNRADSVLSDTFDSINNSSIVQGAKVVSDPLGGTVGLVSNQISSNNFVNQIKLLLGEAKEQIMDAPTIFACKVRDYVEYVVWNTISVWYHLTHLNWKSVIKGTIVGGIVTLVVALIYSALQVAFLINRKPTATKLRGTQWFHIPVQRISALPCQNLPNKPKCGVQMMMADEFGFEQITKSVKDSRVMTRDMGFITLVTLIGTIFFSVLGGIGTLHYAVSHVFEFIRVFLFIRQRQREKGIVFKNFDEAKRTTLKESKVILDALSELRVKRNKKQKIADDLRKQKSKLLKVERRWRKAQRDSLYPSSNMKNAILLVKATISIVVAVLVIIQCICYLITHGEFGFMATAALWIDDNFSSALPILGVVIYLIYCYYLIVFVAYGTTLITRFLPPPLTIYPLKVRNTFLSTLLVLVGMFVLTAFGVNYFMVTTWSKYTDRTQLYRIIALVAGNGRLAHWYLEAAYIYVYFAFAGVGLVFSLIFHAFIQVRGAEVLEGSRWAYVFDED